jgi:hypothetical protein
VAVPQDEEKGVIFHPKQLVSSFAKEGMVCALYEPTEDFPIGKDSEVFNLCDRADVVVFDWDLFNQDGQNLLPLISNLVNESLNSVPHQVRLFVIYTATPDLSLVHSKIENHLSIKNNEIDSDSDRLTLKIFATQIIVRGKKDVPSRTEENKAFEIAEIDLAQKVIDVFAEMNRGLLPSYALHGMSAVRRNSKKILDRFHSDMDGAFLLHRALCFEDQDAFEQLPELLSEEVLAVILDEQISADTMKEISKDTARTLRLNISNIENCKNINGQSLSRTEAEKCVRNYLGAGLPAIKAEFKLPKDHVKKIHTALDCHNTNAEKKLAELFSIRTQYHGAKPPTLGFGTVVRKKKNSSWEYSFCLMPICDGIRLKHGKDPNTNKYKRTSFPFWTLTPVGNGVKGKGIVVLPNMDSYIELLSFGKPRDKLWVDTFVQGKSGTVTARNHTKNKSFWFHGEKAKFQWVAQLKPEHAQRIAHDIGQSLSRVGVVEAEWLRLLTEP